MWGERNAPIFDLDVPLVNDEEKKRYAVMYVPIDVADQWNYLPEKAAPGTFEDFRKAVFTLYPGASTDRQFEYSDLLAVIQEWQQKGISSLTQWGEYYRAFTLRASFLKGKNILSELEQRRLFMQGITGLLKQAIERRLEIKQPDHNSSVPYEMKDIFEAAHHILAGVGNPPSSSNAPTFSNPSTGIAPAAPAGSVVVKTEDLSSLFEGFKDMMQAMSAQVRGGPRSNPVGPMAGNMPFVCHYCGIQGHGIQGCPAVAEDMANGKCKKDVFGKVVLPSGAQVSRNYPGNTMRERFHAWHKANSGQTASNMYAANSYVSDSTEQMVFQISRDPEASAYAFSAQQRCEALERELLSLRKAQKQFDGVHMPPRPAMAPRPIPVTASGPAPAPAPAKPVVPPPMAQPREQDDDDDDDPISRNLAPRIGSDPQLGGPIHPFAKAKDATFASLPPTRNAANYDPVYKSIAPVQSDKRGEDVFNRALLTPYITLSHAELLSLSPEIRSRMRGIFEEVEDEDAPQQAQDSTDVFEQIRAPPIEDSWEDGQPLPRGVYRVPDPVEAYFKEMRAQNRVPQELVVAKESHALRAITALVDNREEIEAIIDPGSQIISMSEAVCHALGLSYDPSIILNMQSANGVVDPSLGLARNVPFQVGELTFYLQVHVIRQAAYDILLGRPFDVLTESLVKNFRNETQTLTITCPNTKEQVTVPTHARGKPKYRMNRSGF
ncbi:hypothetical protein EW026_g7696 [Hermanssonia centrifuga]|uniref:CCHC-type domain-containing protein n=1 Tax=Hermanssonia centrifuga TaxID=98765 RepID=A0A4S4K6Y7_9APHY|nr:hypothetical protein EW026_g7696 [Hermanssonia centrifuga]